MQVYSLLVRRRWSHRHPRFGRDAVSIVEHHRCLVRNGIARRCSITSIEPFVSAPTPCERSRASESCLPERASCGIRTLRRGDAGTRRMWDQLVAVVADEGRQRRVLGGSKGEACSDLGQRLQHANAVGELHLAEGGSSVCQRRCARGAGW